MNWIVLVLLWIVVRFVISKFSSSPQGKLVAGETAVFPAGLQFVKGDAVSEFIPGSFYLIEYWATWCPPCRNSIPHLSALQKKYEGQGLTVIGISAEDVATVSKFVERKGDDMAYRVAVGGKPSYLETFKISGIPHSFLIDSTGHHVWHGHPMEAERFIEELVKHKAAEGKDKDGTDVALDSEGESTQQDSSQEGGEGVGPAKDAKDQRALEEQDEDDAGGAEKDSAEKKDD
mmetsp:Transcript_19771/g.34006  ORF Transcript_19771/g.34006 Transcript_19771/m.34006 type:complete len:232 (-) Transcript_19771:269-964(-)|eukprot:CAMPEP_0196659340 /NCGR_PEP_ID=MMETSP1086-20130531/34450_1 /TAXON_ID=77921 /ORGANISM="Cyanoptyche  gloeocystis , Strain SAG4.97" /LENGTH=231 /DNA_ID=CAMNT_0041993281 /DNA_START=111 /DNA_END=806 /DNA_ORIENTATION=+